VIIPHTLLNVSYKPYHLTPASPTLKLREIQNPLLPRENLVANPQISVNLLAGEKPPSAITNNLATITMNKTTVMT
jgi:hypothetical protein